MNLKSFASPECQRINETHHPNPHRNNNNHSTYSHHAVYLDDQECGE